MPTENPYEPPQFVVEPKPQLPEYSGLVWILFSFDGRIPRRIFWGATLGLMAVFYGIVFSSVLIFGEESSIPGFVVLVMYIPLIWTSLAVQVKRWHDRDKSGWWVLIQMIPIIGPIWSFVETGCLRGTYGDNMYGSDPT
jgi:uncharacterized membrane protein YhaH (DUF805 family)